VEYSASFSPAGPRITSPAAAPPSGENPVFHEIGPYGERNDHYMGDLATFYLALGAVSLVAAGRASWRLPVLSMRPWRP
jgi:hypothetical protein